MKIEIKFWLWEIFTLISVVAMLIGVTSMPNGYFFKSLDWYNVLTISGFIASIVGVFGVTNNLRARGLMR